MRPTRNTTIPPAPDWCRDWELRYVASHAWECDMVIAESIGRTSYSVHQMRRYLRKAGVAA